MTLFRIVLLVHIVTGFTGLLSGVLICILPKATKRHRKLGRAFFVSMLFITFTAVTLAVMNPNSFLLAIGLFSLFLALAGRWAIVNKDTSRAPADIAILALGLGITVYMLFSGNGLLMFFGALNILPLTGFLRYFLSKATGAVAVISRMRMHIGMMVGSFIATLTAFIVVNVPARLYDVVPQWLPWIAPTVVLVPLIFWWSAKLPKGQRTIDERTKGST